jgi:hypothetical protein
LPVLFAIPYLFIKSYAICDNPTKKASFHSKEASSINYHSWLETYASSWRPFEHYLKIFPHDQESFFENNARMLFRTPEAYAGFSKASDTIGAAA